MKPISKEKPLHLISSPMDTYFAPAEKACPETLATEIELISRNPVMNGLLKSIGGLLAILDEHRQIVAVNDAFLQMVGIDNPQQALGLRPGEVLKCIHAEKEPGGCGTSKYCITCGAAIALVTSLTKKGPAEQICALTARKDNKETHFVFKVEAKPIEIDSWRFILLFLRDITNEEKRAALERTFYHDINNTLTMLGQASEMLLKRQSDTLTTSIHLATTRLIREVTMQQYLSDDLEEIYHPSLRNFRVDQILNEIELFFASHPAADNKIIEFEDDFPSLSLRTDITLILRVLNNMVINALEATGRNRTMKIWVEKGKYSITFNVWNEKVIPEVVAIKIFQRHFTTKKEPGRGLGTYSMKLFGEKILGDRVSFSSTPDHGTIFRYTYIQNKKNKI